MHELALAESLIARALERIRELGIHPGAVRLIKVRVGDLSGASPETLGECIQMLLPASEFSGAGLSVERLPAKVLCKTCGELEASSPFRLACPNCGAIPERVDGGRDVFVESVEVEDDIKG